MDPAILSVIALFAGIVAGGLVGLREGYRRALIDVRNSTKTPLREPWIGVHHRDKWTLENYFTDWKTNGSYTQRPLTLTGPFEVRILAVSKTHYKIRYIRPEFTNYLFPEWVPIVECDVISPPEEVLKHEGRIEQARLDKRFAELERTPAFPESKHTTVPDPIREKQEQPA